MFNFIDEIKDVDINDYRYINYAGKKVYVQGFKSLLIFNEEEISLKIKNGELSIFGANLKIEELGRDTVLISGNINEIKTEKI